jgi:hypothetical protein
MKMARFDSLPVGATFTHEQFGQTPFTKESETTALRPSDRDGELERFYPVPSQPVNVTRTPSL